MTETLTKAKTMHAAMTANISKGNPQSDNIKGLTEVSNIISSLITTIESQKEEITELREREYNHYPVVILDLETRIFKLQDDVESLKAITELAVKGLEEVALIYGWNSDTASKDMLQTAQSTLSEIARLQNDPIS